MLYFISNISRQTFLHPAPKIHSFFRFFIGLLLVLLLFCGLMLWHGECDVEGECWFFGEKGGRKGKVEIRWMGNETGGI